MKEDGSCRMAFTQAVSVRLSLTRSSGLPEKGIIYPGFLVVEPLAATTYVHARSRAIYAIRPESSNVSCFGLRLRTARPEAGRPSRAVVPLLLRYGDEHGGPRHACDRSRQGALAD